MSEETNETIDALTLRVGAKEGELYDRVMELYKICRELREGDISMMDIFRSDVEINTETITDGLLALQANPDVLDRIEAMTRAVHSIKGAAQIVELDAGVKVALAMEKCLIAAQKSEISLEANQIDILLKGVDMLKPTSDFQSWAEALFEEAKDKVIIFTCRTGHRSGQVQNVFRSNGHERVINHSGGIVSYRGEIER